MNDNEVPGQTGLVQNFYRNLYGAWQLARFNPQGMTYLDYSPEGFWRSFSAILVSAPLYALLMAMQPDVLEMNGQQLDIPMLVNVLKFIFILPLMAVVMLYLTRFMNVAQNYVPMVVAYNWASVIMLAILIPVFFLATSGIVGDTISSLMLLLTRVVLLMYLWFIFKTSLQISGWLAVGFVVFEIAFSEVFYILLLFILSPETIEQIRQMGATAGP